MTQPPGDPAVVARTTGTHMSQTLREGETSPIRVTVVLREGEPLIFLVSLCLPIIWLQMQVQVWEEANKREE